MSEVYRGRFGVETSYRQMNQCRARTCTRSPAVRLFLVGVAGVIIWSLVNMLVAVLYNLVSDVVGGVQISLGEKEPE